MGTTHLVIDPDEIDSEVLLKQGDELLRSSRRLLDQIGEVGEADVVDLRDGDDAERDPR